MLLLVLAVYLIPYPAFSQNIDALQEFFTFYPNRKSVALDSSIYPSKFIAAPVISYSPETNFAFGIGAKYLFKFAGSGEETRVSNMPITFQYTLNNQYFLYSGFEIFTNQEKWVIEGNILLQNYPRLYYGTGNRTEESAEEVYEYNQLLIEPIFLKQMFLEHLFIGGGFRFNHIYNTEIEEDGLLAINRPDGFEGSTSVGAEVAALYDSRDIILNASTGWYLEFTHGKYGEVLGGTNNFNLTRMDLRHFLRVSKNNEDVLAFQFVGRAVRGKSPFSEFSLLGSSEIMRGYREGRFLDRDFLATQVEYRKNFKNSRIGAVAFLGTGDVYNNIDEFQFSGLKPNYGVGVRFKIDKEENLNLRLDFGFGRGTNEIYLSIAEAF
ncbi:BamA/TamA family outer membrane protein [Nonlabens marinus]|uniref:Outer membrane protein n=1 Tax=Nonlabens marinus S1-08 TaxID=1454201 RepID=W8VW01_9FLAO|nr:BamA/TamA family outer membrane protein [Nonlabens marinus]BAO54317.1 outer membrane protein [Nonlabens marinus S1-08]